MNAREEFTAIVRHLSSIKELVEHYIKAKEEEWNRQHEREKIPVQVNGYFWVARSYRSSTRHQSRAIPHHSKNYSCGRWAAFVAALTYAVIAQLQFGEIRKQTAELYQPRRG